MFSERRVTLKSAAQIDKMAVAGRLVAEVLDRVGAEVRAGVATAELDALAEELIRGADAVPSFIGVPGPRGPFRHSLCISIDDEVVHGIPSGRRLRDGEMVSIDAGAIVDGWHGDAARTFFVGEVSDEARRLSDAAHDAMLAGIAAAQPGGWMDDISGAVEDVALRHGFGVVRQFVGHGIGTEMHEEPQVTNYRTGSRGRKLEAGLCLAIEPMFTLGSHQVRLKDDGWTVVTADGALAAHWENTIAITADGPRVLTSALGTAAAAGSAPAVSPAGSPSDRAGSTPDAQGSALPRSVAL